MEQGNINDEPYHDGWLWVVQVHSNLTSIGLDSIPFHYGLWNEPQASLHEQDCATSHGLFAEFNCLQ